MLNVSNQYVGGTFPLHASATGKLILAELDDARIEELLPAELPRYTPRTVTSRTALLDEVHQVREQGYAVSREGLTEVKDDIVELGIDVVDQEQPLRLDDSEGSRQ